MKKCIRVDQTFPPFYYKGCAYNYKIVGDGLFNTYHVEYKDGFCFTYDKTSFFEMFMDIKTLRENKIKRIFKPK